MIRHCLLTCRKEPGYNDVSEPAVSLRHNSCRGADLDSPVVSQTPEENSFFNPEISEKNRGETFRVVEVAGVLDSHVTMCVHTFLVH